MDETGEREGRKEPNVNGKEDEAMCEEETAGMKFNAKNRRSTYSDM